MNLLSALGHKRSFLVYAEMRLLDLVGTRSISMMALFVPIIRGKSSIARMALFVHVTADLIDIGLVNQWTFQL